ncbi:MAG: cytochrome c oxidase assembly protein [Opitutaceae bacterium]
MTEAGRIAVRRALLVGEVLIIFAIVLAVVAIGGFAIKERIFGILTLGGLWFGPLPELARQSFWAHMALHMGVVAVAAPLLAFGLAGARPIRCAAHRRGFRRFRCRCSNW